MACSNAGHFLFQRCVIFALNERVEFLIEQGLAQRNGQRLVLARDFLTTLRDRELANVGKALAQETGLTHRPAVEASASAVSIAGP